MLFFYNLEFFQRVILIFKNIEGLPRFPAFFWDSNNINRGNYFNFRTDVRTFIRSFTATFFGRYWLSWNRLRIERYRLRFSFLKSCLFNVLHGGFGYAQRVN